MANKGAHRRFGNVRMLSLAGIRFAIRDRTADTYGAGDLRAQGGRGQGARAGRVQMSAGEWSDPERGKSSSPTMRRPGSPSGRAASAWPRITGGCSVSTSYRILGGVPVGKLSTQMVREWRATSSPTARRFRSRPRRTAPAGGAHDGGRRRQDSPP